MKSSYLTTQKRQHDRPLTSNYVWTHYPTFIVSQYSNLGKDTKQLHLCAHNYSLVLLQQLLATSIQYIIF